MEYPDLREEVLTASVDRRRFRGGSGAGTVEGAVLRRRSGDGLGGGNGFAKAFGRRGRWTERICEGVRARGPVDRAHFRGDSERSLVGGPAESVAVAQRGPGSRRWANVRPCASSSVAGTRGIEGSARCA